MRFTLLLAVLLAASLAGCTQDPADDPDDGMDSSPSPTDDGMTGATTHDVDIADFAFSPASLTIQVGDTVRWTNMGSFTHTVDSTDGGPLDSGDLGNGETYSYTFETEGTFPYECIYHGSMQGTITVEA